MRWDKKRSAEGATSTQGCRQDAGNKRIGRWRDGGSRHSSPSPPSPSMSHGVSASAGVAGLAEIMDTDNDNMDSTDLPVRWSSVPTFHLFFSCCRISLLRGVTCLDSAPPPPSPSAGFIPPLPSSISIKRRPTRGRWTCAAPDPGLSRAVGCLAAVPAQ